MDSMSVFQASIYFPKIFPKVFKLITNTKIVTILIRLLSH